KWKQGIDGNIKNKTMKKYILAVILILILGIVLTFGFFHRAKKVIAPESQPTVAEEKQNSYTQADDSIRVSQPASGAEIKSPVEISGEARGTWFFEASFPIRLVDENGQELAHAAAAAQGDWMTEGFVPFKAVLVFDAKGARSGKIILEKDNPSGLPEHAGSFEVPVKFF
ncbi:MAG: Gmad2 immunoglobulin-like domain-containing protein, partial [Candidatus Moranbacteria bacterium]|nr:Gmad2 immunoglobulin-like domain-containing protein [Candidatus Moranbacteria bacterium]